MPELTRRRSLDAPDECWHVYYGDVRVGTIAIRAGIPLSKIRGAGLVASSPGASPGNVPTAQLPPSTRPASNSRMHGECFWRSGRKGILRLGAHSGTGPRG